MNNDRIALLSDTVLRQMAAVERRHGDKKMFQELFPDLEKEINAAMDSKSAAQLNTVIKKLDELT